MECNSSQRFIISSDLSAGSKLCSFPSRFPGGKGGLGGKRGGPGGPQPDEGAQPVAPVALACVAAVAALCVLSPTPKAVAAEARGYYSVAGFSQCPRKVPFHFCTSPCDFESFAFRCSKSFDFVVRQKYES